MLRFILIFVIFLSICFSGEIKVYSKGEVNIAPDMVFYTSLIGKESRIAKKCYIKLDKSFKKIKSSLKKYSIKSPKISKISISKKYINIKGKNVANGYRCYMNVEIYSMVRKDILDVISSLEESKSINIIANYILSDKAKRRAKSISLNKAIIKANQKANEIAKLTDQKLSKISYIEIINDNKASVSTYRVQKSSKFLKKIIETTTVIVKWKTE